METERKMKFYRIQSGGKDVGRLMLDPQGIGKLQLDGHQRPLDVIEKPPGEPWGYVYVDQSSPCPKCKGTGFNEADYPDGSRIKTEDCDECCGTGTVMADREEA